MVSPGSDEDDFTALATEAIRVADPAPPVVKELAKLAFEFSNITTIEADQSRAMAGARSDDNHTVSSFANGDHRVSWQTRDGELFGVVSGDLRKISLQTTETIETLSITDESTFEVVLPALPFRLVIDTAAGTWATTWNRDA